jgi:hypothetical protein
MGVDVDESGRDQQAARVDLASRRTGVLRDRRDAALVDRDVGDALGRAGSVDDAPTAKD